MLPPLDAAPAFTDSAVQRLLNQQQQLRERETDRMLRRARLAALLLAKRRRGTWVLAPLSLFLYLPMSIDAVQFVPQMEEGAGSPSPSLVRVDDVAYKERHVILPPPYLALGHEYQSNGKGET